MKGDFMKKYWKILILVGILITAAAVVKFISRGPANGGDHHETHSTAKPKISYYTCSMHPQIHRDEPGDCPICGMRLIPVFESDMSDTSDQSNSIKISPERQQLIGVKTEAAIKKLVLKEIRTLGRVAFDPELAVAEREFVEIVQNVPSLRAAAVSRLRLLGMSEEEIRVLEKKGKGNLPSGSTNLYLPKEGDSVWVYATLYEGEMDLVSPGDKATITLPSSATKSFEGVVRAVDPVVNAMTRSVRARIEVPKGGGGLRPDSYVDVVMNVDLGEQLVIPKSAVIDTGTRRVVFVMKEGNLPEGQTFESRDIKTSAELVDEVVVAEGLHEGEVVVNKATFLVDSESQLKAAVTGGHQH